MRDDINNRITRSTGRKYLCYSCSQERDWDDLWYKADDRLRCVCLTCKPKINEQLQLGRSMHDICNIDASQKLVLVNALTPEYRAYLDDVEANAPNWFEWNLKTDEFGKQYSEYLYLVRPFDMSDGEYSLRDSYSDVLTKCLRKWTCDLFTGVRFKC